MASNRPKLKKEDVVQALVDANGQRNAAADILGCDHSTIWRWCKRDPEVQAICDAMDKRVVDIAQERLTDMVIEGNNLGALIFYLKTRGGWSEKQQIEHSGEVKTQHVEPPPRPKDMDEWRQRRQQVVLALQEDDA